MGPARLVEIVRRPAEEPATRGRRRVVEPSSGLGRRHVVGADVCSVRVLLHREIDAIVDHDERRSLRPPPPRDVDRDPHAVGEFVLGDRLLAHLQHRHAGVDEIRDEPREGRRLHAAADEHAQRGVGEAGQRVGHERSPYPAQPPAPVDHHRDGIRMGLIPGARNALAKPAPDPTIPPPLSEAAVVGTLRYLTILWPGLPWLWLRGSLPGIVLALAFAVTLDVAMVTTWIWTDLVELPFKLAAWAGAAAIWLLGTASALSAFPPPIPTGLGPAHEARFIQARDAYLARDWVGAERRLRELLRDAPTDGEAQLLLGTLLRRAGRLTEARDALEALARSDAGLPWRTAIARELALVASTERAPTDDPILLPLATGEESEDDRVAA